MGRTSSPHRPLGSRTDVGGQDLRPCRRTPGDTSMDATKEVSQMMPMMSWMSVLAWFTLLGILLFIAGSAMLIALAVDARRKRSSATPPMHHPHTPQGSVR
jgi:hypothetical protein